ncbi:Phosphoglucomutase-2 [Rhizina undulata]
MLTPSDSPLVWIDCEMTGLDRDRDVILQICCYITDSHLNLLEESGFETVIHHPQSVLDGMGEWCQRTHSQTGLTSRVLASTTTPGAAAAALLAYIKKHVPEPRRALLAGNSVHADKSFLEKEYREVVEWLHYRIVDVSTVKEAARMWCSAEIRGNVPEKKETHEARMDILESIEEMRYYKKCLFDGR